MNSSPAERFSLGISVVFAFTLLISSAEAQTGVQLGTGEMAIVNGARCGLIRGAWTPGSILKSGKFYSLSQQVKDLKKRAKKKGLSAGARKKLKAKTTSISKKLKRQKPLCARVPSLLTPSPTPTSIATPLPGAESVVWNRDVSDVGTNLGSEYLFFCPANPGTALDGIWGTDWYTTDSAVCVAGVHAGIFNKGSGGNIKVRIKEGRSLYIGSVRHGVESGFYGIFSSSFVFIDLLTGAEILSTDIPQIKWTTDAYAVYQLIDQEFTFLCPAGGTADGIWGTDIYTYDSSICTAAVHAGVISFGNGGPVTIRLRPGAPSYTGSTRNGVTSSSYGAWGGSFIFVR